MNDEKKCPEDGCVVNFHGGHGKRNKRYPISGREYWCDHADQDNLALRRDGWYVYCTVKKCMVKVAEREVKQNE
jgi:hypothetical protein